MIEGTTSGRIAKGPRGYMFPINYLLADGRRVMAHSSHTLKREAAAEMASLPKLPWCKMAANFDENGRYEGFTAEPFTKHVPINA